MPWFVFSSLALVSIVSCSDLGSDEEMGGDEPGVFTDPAAVERSIPVGCVIDIDSLEQPVYSWKLSVDPGPIVAGEPFGAALGGAIVIGEQTLRRSQEMLSAAARRNLLLEAKATVRARSGIQLDGGLEREVVLVHEPIPTTCRFDASGGRAGPYPPCDPNNDRPTGANTDCVGLGGEPTPENPCGEFIEIPLSEECEPGGVCDQLGKLAQCTSVGVCVTEPQEIPLKTVYEAFVAEDSGGVLFGWADEGTGAVLQPNGTWQLPFGIFSDEIRANSIEVLVDGDDENAAVFECAMASGAGRLDRVSDAELIRFPIQRP